jgi:transmembrane sensor
MTDVVRSDAALKATAREWLLRLELEQPSAEERVRFETWRAEDPRHDAAYQRFQSIWRDAAALKELASLAPLNAPVSIPARPRRRAWMMTGTALAASVALALVVFRFDLVAGWTAPSSGQYSTGTAETRTLKLADGSTLVLGAKSALEVAYRDDERRVSLTAGEAYFSVAKDPLRPFVVEAGDKQVRVLGTVFEVRRGGDGLRVSVVEGVVEVVEIVQAPSGQPITRQVLHAGQQTHARIGGEIQAPQPMAHKEAAAWRHGRRVYVDAPLHEVVADANRYSRQAIRIADPEVAELKVSVTYSSERVEEMLGALARSLPVEVERKRDGGIWIKAR